MRQLLAQALGLVSFLLRQSCCSKALDKLISLRAFLCGCCEKVEVTDETGHVVAPSKDDEETALRKIAAAQESLPDE